MTGSTTLYSRQNDKRHGAIVLTIQHTAPARRRFGRSSARPRSRGRSCSSQRLPKPTNCTRSRRSEDPDVSAAARGGLASRREPIAPRPLPPPSANTISRPNISSPRPRSAAAWSRPAGPSATGQRIGRIASTGSCRTGTPPIRQRSSEELTVLPTPRLARTPACRRSAPSSGCMRHLDRDRDALAAPSVEQRLAAIRHLFDWLVTGPVVRSTRPRRCAGPGTS